MSTTQNGSALTRILLLLLPLAIAALAALVYLGNPLSTSRQSGNVAEVAALSQGLPLMAEQAASGDRVALTRLGDALDRLDTLKSEGVFPNDTGALFERLRIDAGNVQAAGESLSNVRPAVRNVSERLTELVAGGGELLNSSDAAPIAAEFQSSAASLAESLQMFADAEGDVRAHAVTASEALDYIDRVLAALAGADNIDIDLAALTASSKLAQLEGVRSVFDQIASDATTALSAEEDLLKAEGSVRSLKSTSERLYAPVSAAGQSAGAGTTDWILLGIIGFSLLASLWLAIAYVRTERVARAAGHQAEQNDRNQQAILRLLDELGSLADGDLTVQATVTEDITGAIADSINYAIEALRDLVATINDTAIMVDSAAKQTEAAAQNMSGSARQQAIEVTATTDALGAIVAAIEEVSGNAERSSDVARHSVDVAHKGGEAVRRTIDGMNAIRETIQETSKRIKRLGESSQEIGNIVELINDIAEQTNILALNASIQASMAGEAGRGFAVVADEVQRLAERCTNATKQIEVLVRTIQTDTNEAVVSMERSTTDVVGGALLAENAGAALDEIEQVSNQIASLVQNISGSAREQSAVAADIDTRTSNLRQISEKTGRETAATAAAIHKLSELASQLRNTVAGFQLPDIGASSGVYTTDDKPGDSQAAAPGDDKASRAAQA